jgi:hypothetical protein
VITLPAAAPTVVGVPPRSPLGRLDPLDPPHPASRRSDASSQGATRDT